MPDDLPDPRDLFTGLRFLAAKVAAVHGASHPETAALAEAVSALAQPPPDDPTRQAALGRRIAIMTNDFTPWVGSCGSVQRLFAGLKIAVGAIPQPHESRAP
jgi:iron-sulfur cluster repair protein YtfE (RIC family)